MQQSVLFDPVLTLSLVSERRAELMAEARHEQIVDQALRYTARRTPVHLPVTASGGFRRTGRLLLAALRSMSFSPARF